MKNWTTTELRDGTKVLAKVYGGEIDPVRYANYTQANARVTALLLAGIAAYVVRPITGQAIYIGIGD